MKTIDYKIIDVHVHIIPLDMLKPAARAAIEATQPDLARLKDLTSDPHKLVAYMDKHNIERL